ncbi:hypothetical protein BAMA_03140 [Bacillus manliponensis]|uniref:Uncharacterized protein n=1 Tax=Bacillus manliponensis TaxID=574376 RepID=A0A073JX01_9BACI|nr:hypothetical protein [Bacillus manliponensis]KEK18786.1 hypothetical protein BAMA_03140 [Bacillus manliponensis]
MSYTPKPTPNYMSSDWGTSNAKTTALKIDHVADKAKFAVQMLESALKGFDTIEKEIIDASESTTPPTRESIRAFAYRIDTCQNQLQDGLTQLKQMMEDIDKTTDTIQQSKTSW